MTKVAQQKIENYRRATATELWDVYGSFSKGKVNAYKYCKELQEEYNGYDFRICGANSHQFSAGFLYRDGDGIEHLMYITKSQNHDIRLDEEE